MILGDTKNQRKEQQKHFKELYNFRSNLVHGNRFDKKVYESHLAKARIMARDLIVWVLHYLSSIKQAYSENAELSELPNRSQLLSFIDLDVFDREHLNKLINNLPSDFPRTNTWFDKVDSAYLSDEKNKL